MFVTIDDLWQKIAPIYDRPGPEPTTCSDSERIPIAIVRECRGWDRETHLMAEWKPYGIPSGTPAQPGLGCQWSDLWLVRLEEKDLFWLSVEPCHHVRWGNS